MANSLSQWNKVLGSILEIPGAKVNRAKFLEGEFRQYYDEFSINRIITEVASPYEVVTVATLNKIADKRIDFYAKIASSISFFTGLPGGFTMLAALPADMIQYYFYLFKIAQELAYLYGFHDFCDENGKLTERSLNTLTILIGVMTGASGSINVAGQKIIISQALEQMPKIAFYQISKEIAIELGIRLSTRSIVKGVSLAVPFLGGVASSLITRYSFKPSAKRLKNRLEADLNIKKTK